MKTRLSDGFEVEIIDNVADDWEFLEVLTGIDEGETGLIVKAAKMMLGNDGVKSLKDHLRGEDGVVKTTEMVEALKDILNNTGETKNS